MASGTDLPGFRFHPTEEELLDFYLRNTILGKKSSFDVIGFLNIYRHDPRELPGLSKIHGEREWYFFVPRDRKHGSSGRPNRTTETGFWKATGSDRKILKSSDPKNVMGLRKTLVFYLGRAPRGNKTDWIMNEYRLPDNSPLPKEMVLCKIYRKATSMKVLEQRAAAMEEEEEEEEETMKKIILQPSSSSSSPVHETVSFSCSLNAKSQSTEPILQKNELGVESGGAELMKKNNPIITNSLRLPFEDDQLPQLQLPRFTTEWDNFWSQLNSPWFHTLIVSPNIINF